MGHEPDEENTPRDGLQSICSGKPSCGSSPGPARLHLLPEADCAPGGVSTHQMTAVLMPQRKADTCWHSSSGHFFFFKKNLRAEQGLR